MQSQDALSGVEGSLLLGQPLSGAVVDQGVEGVLDDRLSERTRRVVGAAATSVGACRDVDAATGDHHGASEGIVAQEPSEGAYALDEGCVVVAGCTEPVEATGLQGGAEGVGQGVG